jgi:hypothetical protein
LLEMPLCEKENPGGTKRTIAWTVFQNDYEDARPQL